MNHLHRVSRLFKVLLLTGMALTLYLCVIWVKRPEVVTVARRLGPAWTLLQNNGQLHADDLPEFSESTDDEKIYLMNILRQTVGNLFSKCEENMKRCPTSSNGKHRLLTLFTTWELDHEKLSVNNRTLFNWRTLPETTLVVFSSSSDVKYYSRQAGFEVLPVVAEASGAPVLPTMFTTVQQKFKSEFYGFANGDILFTNSLIETLKSIQCRLDRKARTNGLLIVGRRMNIPASLLTDEMSTSWSQLERVAAQRGKLFVTDAEDYFITDNQYPWQNFLPVAIGRRGYDNWAVAYSRYHNISVIDATESIFCLHQTLELRGNYEGIARGNYNIHLIEKLNMPFSFGEWGRTTCAGLKTWVDLCGETVISERKQLRKECTAYHWSYSILRMLSLRS